MLHLNIAKNGIVTDKAFAFSAQFLHQLRALDLSECPKLTGKDLTLICCVVLCCVVLCCVVLCCFMLCYVMLCYVMLDYEFHF